MRDTQLGGRKIELLSSVGAPFGSLYSLRLLKRIIGYILRVVVPSICGSWPYVESLDAFDEYLT